MGRLTSWWRNLSRRGKLITVAAVSFLVVIGAASAGRPTDGNASGSGDSSARLIPGLTTADVKLNLENRGLTCDGGSTTGNGTVWTCKGSDATTDWEVDIFGTSVLEIRSVDAVVLWSGAGDGGAAFDAFLGYVATLPYDGAQPEAAKAWVVANENGTKSFGDASYALASATTGRARTLTITGTR
jgi:hypothetical protein